MKKLLLLLALLPSSAFAADMAIKAPPAVVQSSSWSGLYVGIQGGENLGSFNPLAGNTAVNFSDNSPLFGGQIGYLLQTRTGFVIGPEFGAQWMNWNKTVTMGTGDTATLLQNKIDWLLYLNLRAGIPVGNMLVYVTGGGAWAHAAGQVISAPSLSVVQSNLGWDIGAGVEIPLSTNLVLGAEYRHYDFSKATTIIGLSPASLTTDQALGRLSYRLN